MKFRRRAKLFPGVTLNFSGSGISTTVGFRGASINFGKKGTYLNTGIPGTGLYDRKRIDSGYRSPSNSSLHSEIDSKDSIPRSSLEIDPSAELIESSAAESTTSEGLEAVKETLLDCHFERQQLQKEIAAAKNGVTFSKTIHILSRILVVGFFVPWFKRSLDEKKAILDELIEELTECRVNVDINLAPEFETPYSDSVLAFAELCTSHRIWDITSKKTVNSKAERTTAGASITRTEVSFDRRSLDFLESKYASMYMQNANGADIYFYPAFVVVIDSNKKFGLIDLRDLNFHFSAQMFIESEKVPADSVVVRKTWFKANKDGSRDKRFNGNYEIPVCRYGFIELSSKTGLNEAYHVSSYEKAEAFANKISTYLAAIGVTYKA